MSVFLITFSTPVPIIDQDRYTECTCTRIYIINLLLFIYVETYLIFGTVTPDLTPGLTWGLTPNVIRVSYPKINLSLPGK